MSLLGIGYAVIALGAWRPIAGHIAWVMARSWQQNKPDATDWLAGYTFGAAAAALWPLTAILGVSTLALPKIGAEREAHKRHRIDDHHSTIRQLERSTGIDTHE